MDQNQELLEIPEPPGLPFLGNVMDLDKEFPLGSLIHLADVYGPIYKLNLAGNERIVVSTYALVNEVSDESRFAKKVSGPLAQIRNGVHDGLFTALGPQEENWGIAHRILMPAFSPMSIRGMFDQMHDIASQLVMKWARYGPDNPIHVTEDFTRLTLDTLALCAMDYRFNSYYSDRLHPFIASMEGFLKESGLRTQRPGFTSMFYRNAEVKFWADIESMRKTSDEVLAARKAHPNAKKDLLNAMLNGRDPKTGKGMTDSSITDNLITFLIAGHETTSGLLSFAFFNLLKHPNALRRAQEEVDEVIGSGPIKVEHLSKLPYISAILRETLRQNAPISAWQVAAKEDTILGSKYRLPKDVPIVALLAKSHLDPTVFGEDANEWKPERMLDEEFDRLNREFPNCWKPFGNGMRACIGRPFAWQEALLVVALLLQKFNFVAVDTTFQLHLKQTLTIKPKDFYMRAIPRGGMSADALNNTLHATKTDSTVTKDTTAGRHINGSAADDTDSESLMPLHVLYGSNTGTCESLAQRLATDATAHGFSAKTVDCLDSVKEKMPQDEPVVIITASYEGQPPDNATQFVSWLTSLKDNELAGVPYAVFGCGHREWVQTYHRIPKLLDSQLGERGGSRIVEMGLTDVSSGDMFTDFEAWQAQHFWPAMEERFETKASKREIASSSGIHVDFSTPRKSNLRQDVNEAEVIGVKTLTGIDVDAKRHIEIGLPSGLTYIPGDYLAVLPINPKETVHRAMRRFGIPWDCHVTLTATAPTTLPIGTSISASDVLGAYVELSQPATKRDLTILIEASEDELAKSSLEQLYNAYASDIVSKRVSILDLLERYPDIKFPFGSYLSMLPPMRVRQYSISSSPLRDPTRATLTYAVLNKPSLSGQGRYVGVASNYLSSLEPGDKLHIAIRKSHQAFHLPQEPEQIPIIMVGAGTGIAPFRGFVQERAAQLGAGRSLADALLFFGCRNSTEDDLYREEFDRWERLGAVTVYRAYSREPAKTKDCKYAQDRLWEERNEIVALWKRGAKVFVCGSPDLADGVKKTCIRIGQDQKRIDGGQLSEEQAEQWFERMRNVRYATDVFA